MAASMAACRILHGMGSIFYERTSFWIHGWFGGDWIFYFT
jgi:hypothetical protein